MKKVKVSLVIGVLIGILDTQAVDRHELMTTLERYRNEDIAPQVVSSLAQRTNISEDTARTLLRAFKKNKLTEEIVEGALAESNRRPHAQGESFVPPPPPPPAGNIPPPPPFPTHLFHSAPADPLAEARSRQAGAKNRQGARTPPSADTPRAGADLQAELKERLARRADRVPGSSSPEGRRSPSPRHVERNIEAEIAQIQREIRAEEKRIEDAQRKLAQLRERKDALIKKQESEA